MPDDFNAIVRPFLAFRLDMDLARGAIPIQPGLAMVAIPAALVPLGFPTNAFAFQGNPKPFLLDAQGFHPLALLLFALDPLTFATLAFHAFTFALLEFPMRNASVVAIPIAILSSPTILETRAREGSGSKGKSEGSGDLVHDLISSEVGSVAVEG